MSPVVMNIIGQAVGFVAIAMAFLSFQVRRRSGILFIQASANVVWALHFFMIGTPTGAIINLFCTVRNLIYAQKERWRWVGNCATPILISVIAVVLSVLTADGWIDYLLLPSTIISSIAFYLSDEKKIRFLSIFICLSWLAFNIFELSISGICAEVFNLVSIVIAIIRFAVVEKKQKNANELATTAENISIERFEDKQNN